MKFDDLADMHTHLELLKLGFTWRWANPGERCQDGQLARRVYTLEDESIQDVLHIQDQQ